MVTDKELESPEEQGPVYILLLLNLFSIVSKHPNYLQAPLHFFFFLGAHIHLMAIGMFILQTSKHPDKAA